MFLGGRCERGAVREAAETARIDKKASCLFPQSRARRQHRPFTIANGSTFQFTDELYQAFGTFTTVSFSNNQIRLTNLVSGIFPPYTAASFQFPGSSVLSASVNASSSPLFAPGSILSVSGNTILLNLSGTCERCVGTTLGRPRRKHRARRGRRRRP